LLIEQISETLDVHAAQLAEPVLSIDDVTEKFNVTSKTIQRWRRKGLPARRFIFADGRRRVGFLLNSVERFLSAHQEQVARGTNFSQVSDVERDDILRRAKRLATMCHCCTNEIARRIARKLGRSHLTVLHTIRKHDAEHPHEAIFPHASDPISEDDRGRILKAYRHGVAMQSLASRYCKPRSAIYRVVVEERIAKLNRRKVRFIDDTLYHQPDADEVIEHIASEAQAALAPTASRPEENRIPRDLPPYLQDLYRTPLLTPAAERALFLKFNWHKYQFVQARRKLEPQFARARDLNVLEGHLRKAIDTKNAIVRANLRLVVSIARKHLRPNLSLMELISDGNMTLMRAVDSFDTHKGNRFSTYSTLALMKGFARSVPLMLADHAGTKRLGGARREALETEMPDPRAGATPVERLGHRDEVHKLVSQLDDRERAVLLAHFGIADSADDAPSREIATRGVADQPSYEQLGERFGLSAQRIRQIERGAMAKLRATVR